MRRIRITLSVLAVAALVWSSAATGLADNGATGNRPIEEFDDFEVFIEINATDLDAGLQGVVDGPAWRKALVHGPDRTSVFRFQPTNALREHGVTEERWESHEPPFEPSPEAEPGYTLDAFLELFPEGPYLAKGKTIDGANLRSETELTHDLPAAPLVTSHDEDDEVDNTTDMVVTWDEVTSEFAPDDPQGQATDPLGSDIVQYIVVVEYVLVTHLGGPDEEEIANTVTVEVGPDTLSATIPAMFLPPTPDPGDDLEFKIGVGASEESGNLTFWEVPLTVATPV